MELGMDEKMMEWNDGMVGIKERNYCSLTKNHANVLLQISLVHFASIALKLLKFI